MKQIRRSLLVLGMGLSLTLAACAEVVKTAFGQTKEGVAVEQFTLTNGHGVTARLMTYGATWTHMLVPDKDGKLGDVLLGFDTLEPYLAEHPYFGVTVGRVGNRIARGRFTLDGKTYQLAVNNGPNHLHGGLEGFDKVVWKAEPLEDNAVKFTYTDPDGSNGYPGTVSATVVYTLTEQDELRIDYTATTDQATPINLTNHAYFNLGTAASGTILDHQLQIFADRFTPVDDTLIPTGVIAAVRDTPMDFTRPRTIGSRISQVGANPTGYDHNYVLNGPQGDFKKVARVRDPQSGRRLEILSDQPGVQFYTGNFLDGSLKGKDGVVYQKNYGFCLETQHFPDSVHHGNFPSIILRPGQTYRTSTVHRFSVSD